MLHVYHLAQNKNFKRAGSAAEVTRFFLMNTPVTDEGLRELAVDLKSLETNQHDARYQSDRQRRRRAEEGTTKADGIEMSIHRVT